MTVDEIFPKLPPKCGVCHHEQRFAIQKAIDDGLSYEKIETKFGVPPHTAQWHNKQGHRDVLMKWGWHDKALRENSKVYDSLLCDMAKKAKEALDQMDPASMKPSDIIKLIELGFKKEGDLTNKTEIIVKKDLGEAITEYLNKEETKSNNEEIKE